MAYSLLNSLKIIRPSLAPEVVQPRAVLPRPVAAGRAPGPVGVAAGVRPQVAGPVGGTAANPPPITVSGAAGFTAVELGR